MDQNPSGYVTGVGVSLPQQTQVRVPEVMDAINNLGSELEILEKTVEELGVRLIPVTRPPEDAGREKNTPPVGSAVPVATQLRTLTNRAQMIRLTVAALISRLEV